MHPGTTLIKILLIVGIAVSALPDFDSISKSHPIKRAHAIPTQAKDFSILLPSDSNRCQVVQHKCMTSFVLSGQAASTTPLFRPIKLTRCITPSLTPLALHCLLTV